MTCSHSCSQAMYNVDPFSMLTIDMLSGRCFPMWFLRAWQPDKPMISLISLWQGFSESWQRGQAVEWKAQLEAMKASCAASDRSNDSWWLMVLIFGYVWWVWWFPGVNGMVLVYVYDSFCLMVKSGWLLCGQWRPMVSQSTKISRFQK